MGVRCCHCFASPVSQEMGFVFKQYMHKDRKDVYELSSRGAFVRFLKRQNCKLTLSEYYENEENGQYSNGIWCQNVEKLTFASNSFDICTSLEVFEHVENDLLGFQEIYRVLKSTGVLIFTVPLDLNKKTTERTAVINNKRKNILPPEYHSDTIRGTAKVFCFRNYGSDIVDRLHQAGFKHCKIHTPPESKLFGFARPVIIAMKS